MANVNQPTNVAIKEKDINNKLQLYGILQAFSNGKVPSNKQIDVALNSALGSKYLSSPSSKLSQEGRELVADLKEVINEAKRLLLSKNEGNLLQEFVWSTQNLDGGSASVPGAPTDKQTSKQHGNEALDGLRTLGTLIISNGQFRKLLNDATILIRDMAGDAAQNAANRVNPSDEQLRQIDEPAEDNTWHEVPDLSKDNLKAQYQQNKPFSRGDVKEAAQKGADTAQNDPSADNRDSARAGLSQAAGHLQERSQQNVPDENQDEAQKRAQQVKDNAVETKRNAVHSSKQYMSKKMPQERRDQAIWRLKKMVVEIQGHEDYQEAIETLLNLAETYAGHARTMKQQSTGAVKDAHDDDSLRTAEVSLKTLIERFANSTSTDDLFEALNNIYRDAEQDPELKNWFKSVDRYIRKCLQQQGYILKDEATDEGDALYDRGQYLLRDRYRDHTDRLLDETKFLADQFEQDPQNQKFAQSCQKLFNDLGHDENGKATFKPHLVKDLVNVIIPGIFQNTRYVPIPRIEVSDPMIDAIVENLVVESDNLFPNMMEFSNDNYYRMGRRQNSSASSQKVMISASGIQMDLKDVAYYVKKKEGFPSVTDKGVMDVTMAGEGFSFKLAARTADPKDRTHFVAVDKVEVKVNNLSIKLKQSNHKLLFNIAKPLLLKVMRPVIQKTIEKQIKSQFEELDAFAYSIYKDVEKATKAAADDPDNAQNIFQTYVSAFQKKLIQKKKEAAAKASNTTVNMAITKQDSIFKNISLPGGISTKATEYKTLAAKGDKWESPIFGIGSAKESSGLPKPAPITRKPHNAASGTVRGGNHPNADGNRSFSTDTAMTGSTERTAIAPSSGFSNQVDRAFDMPKTNGNNMSSPLGSNIDKPMGDNTMQQTGHANYYSNVTN